MKGIYGLGLAIALGVGATVLNYTYLWRKSQEFEMVDFIGIKDGETIARGEPFKEDKLDKVSIPKDRVGDLEKLAVRYTSGGLQSVIGSPAGRTLNGKALLLRDDLKTPPPQELKPADDERVWPVQLEAQQFPLYWVMPGDEISFLFPVTSGVAPTPAPVPEAGEPAADGDDGGNNDAPKEKEKKPLLSGAIDPVGPFRVLSLGNRLGSVQVMQAAKIPQSQENVITIAVKYVNNQPEEKALKFFRLWHTTNHSAVVVEWHPRKTVKK
jgi:hypothetical protein